MSIKNPLNSLSPMSHSQRLLYDVTNGLRVAQSGCVGHKKSTNNRDHNENKYHGQHHVNIEKGSVNFQSWLVFLYKLQYKASDWSRWPSRPIRGLRYIVTCTIIGLLVFTSIRSISCNVSHEEPLYIFCIRENLVIKDW